MMGAAGMNEFRKPYEYEEEKGGGGLLLFLFVMLIAAEPLLGIISFFLGYNSLQTNRVYSIVLMTAAAIFTAFSIFSAVILKLKKKSSVRVIKFYLIFRLIYLIPYTIVNFHNQVEEIPYYKSSEMYMVTYNSLITSLVISIVYVVVFSAGWYIYLIRSRRIKEIVTDENAGSVTIEQDGK